MSSVDESADIRTLDGTVIDEIAKEIQKVQETSEKIKANDKAGRQFQKIQNRAKGQVTDPDIEKIKADIMDDIRKENAEELDEAIQSIDDKILEFAGDISNPIDFITKIFKNNAAVARILGTSAAVIFIAEAIKNISIAMHEAGGPLDTRVKVLEVIRSIPELELLVDAKQGKVFFTPQTRLRQGIVNKSLSQSLKDGEDIYTTENVGSIMMRGF